MLRLPDNRRDLWPCEIHTMSRNLLEWVRKLSMECPDDTKGRPIPPEIYEEAILWMQSHNPNIQLLSSKELIELIGTSNTLFCGHYIYPTPI